MKRLVIVCAVAIALHPFLVHAQEPPPEPLGRFTLVEAAPGAYQLEFQAVSDRSPYIVSFLTSQIGTDQGVGGQLEEANESNFIIDLTLPLNGMTQAGCYRVSFSVRPKEDNTPFGDSTAGADLETRGCVDAAGRVSFPAHDSVVAPPPPPPSNVRVTPHNDQWKIEWTDNSDEELSFDPGIIFFDRPWAEGGSVLAELTMPEVPANQTSAFGLGSFFFPDEPAESTCGYAMVLVFAIGPDSPSVWPGNTTVPACFGGGTLTFPETGMGRDGRPADIRLPSLLLVLGITFLLAGLGSRTRSWLQ